MTRFLQTLLAVVCCLAGSTALIAQISAPAPHPATLRFLFLEDRPAAYYVQSGKSEYRKISSSPYAISIPYVPPSLEPVRIYRHQKQPPAGPAGTTPSPYVEVATVTPSSTSSSTLIVFIPQPPVAPSTTPGLRAVEYDADPSGFPAGSIRVINLGRAEMAVQLGSATPAQVSPGSTTVMRPSPDSQDRVPARIAFQDTSGWRILSNKILMLRPEQRITGVFVYSPSGMRHTYTREEIAEFGQPKPGHAWLTFTDTPPPPALAAR